MSDADDAPLTPKLDALGVWGPGTPPDDFADRVLARARAEAGTGGLDGAAVAAGSTLATTEAVPPDRRPQRAWRGWVRRGLALGSAAAIVGIVGILAFGLTGRVTPGELEATRRRTVEIGDAAVVVAERGASLRWGPADGGVQVTQDRGAVFYRVEDGDPFEVLTPAGVVQVTGTCFTVDVTGAGLEEMQTMDKSKTRAAALGAAIAAAVTVTVYEGSTVLANDEGEVALRPGQTGRAVAGQAPRQVMAADEPAVAQRAPAPRAGDDAVVARYERELSQLRAELARARDEHGPDDGVEDAGDDAAGSGERFAAGGPPKPEGFDYYDPTPEALEKMAECGVVAWDQPPVWADDQQLDPEYLAALGLSADEEVALQEEFERFRDEAHAQARALWVELGGDPVAADALAGSELLGLVYGRTELGEREKARELLAMEKAGLAQAPGEASSATDRFVRWEAQLGDSFEVSLAQRLGAERSRELRSTRRGWSGKRLTWADLCVEHGGE